MPNNPIKGAVDPTVARKVKPLLIFDICFSIPTSKIPLIFSTKLVLDFDFKSPCIDSLNKDVIGSSTFEGRLL